MSRRPSRQRPFNDGGIAEPAVSIVLAVFDPPHSALLTQLRAIADQGSTDWECIVVNDASTDPGIAAIVDEWAAHSTNRRVIHRSENGGIAAATNTGLDVALGEIVTICDHDDVIDADAVAAIVDHFARHPAHDVVYTDEQSIDADGVVIAHYPKPEYSPRRHLGHHYLAHLVAARRSAIGDVRVRSEFEPAQDYDFWIRVIERVTAAKRKVGHIPRILYSWRAIAGSSALDAAEKPAMTDAVRRCAQAAVDRRGLARRAVTVQFEGRPTTSVLLVPSDANPVAVTPPTIELIEIGTHTDARHLNDLASASAADVVCFVPTGVDVDTAWAAPLADEAVQPDVGVVGPDIVTPEGRRASVGRIVLPFLADPFRGEPAGSSGPWGAFFVVREVSAVAPAGLTVARETFMRAGGFATDVSLDVAAAELCLTLAAAGHSTLQHPGVTLVHDLVEPSADDFDLVRDTTRARDRLGDRWAEPYHLLGPADVERRAPDSYRRLLHLVAGGRVDLVTSDVFDTLVTRAVATPSDLFIALADRIELPAHVTPTVFAAARRSAELRARQARVSHRRRELLSAEPTTSEAALARDPMIAAPEVRLDEIWALMPDGWTDAGLAIAAELTLEGDSLRPIPAAIEALEHARRAGIPVVLLSDIYLTSEQLTSVLSRAGVDMTLVDQVVTSADHRLGKAHGLLERTLAERGVAPDRVVHLGDNEIADIDTATSLGAHAIHLDIPSTRRAVDIPPGPLLEWSSANGGDLGISAAVRGVLVEAGPEGLDPTFQFGAAIVGPVLAGFSRWVAETTMDLGGSHVHCMLREGATIADLLTLTTPRGPTPVPFHVSRWVIMRAAVIDATPDELFTALARRADLSVAHVVEAFGCDADRVREVLGAESVRPQEVPTACAALANDDVVRDQIIASAAELRGRVLTYLRSTLILPDGEPFVLADVGWGGTIQEGLTRILRSDGIDVETIGLYLAVSGAGEERMARGARMYSYLPSETDDAEAAEHSRAVAHHADTIERIMTPAIGTLIDIDQRGAPVCRPVGHDPIPPTLQAAQRAMRLVVDRLADPAIGPGGLADPGWLDPSLRAAFARTIADVITTPSRALAEPLGAWPHDDVAGTAHRPIAGTDLVDIIPFASIRDVDQLDPTGRKWVAGLAARFNPALSAQIAAKRAGVATAGLAPDGENGFALLAAFEVGSNEPALKVAHPVAVLPAGWSMIRMRGDVQSLRSLRFDSGDGAAIVEIAYFSVVLSTAGDGLRSEPNIALTDPRLVFVDAHRIGTRRFVHRAGGHMVLDIETTDVRHVEVTVAFRCWRIDADDDDLLSRSMAERVAQSTRRVGRRITRTAAIARRRHP